MKYKLGLVSISFRKHSPQEILSYMREAGLTCVEWGSDVHAPKDNLDRLCEIARLQKEYGIECSSYGTYFRLGTNNVSELDDYIKAAKILGTDILRLWCGDKNSEDYSNDEKDCLFNECIAAAKVAELHNVTLCMECHNWSYTNTKESALELMKTVNSENFRMYWQPNQFREFEENIEYAKKIAPYSKHIHVFKWRGQKKFSLNQGIDEWKAFINCFNGERSLLLEFMPDDRIESLKEEANALKLIAGDDSQ